MSIPLISSSHRATRLADSRNHLTQQDTSCFRKASTTPSVTENFIMHISKLAATIAFLSSALARPRPAMNEPDLILCFDPATGTYRQCPYIDIVNQYIPGLVNGKRFTRHLSRKYSHGYRRQEQWRYGTLGASWCSGTSLALHRQGNFRNPFVGGWLCERPELLYVTLR